MKKILYIIPILFFANIANAGFVIDHTSTNLDDIPDEWITKAKEDLHIDYSHTSHGSQLITGMNALENFPNFGTDYDWTDTSHGDTSVLSLDDHWGPDLSTGDADSDADGIANWAEDTYTLLDNPSNNHINVVLWSWCNISGHDIDRYVRSMEWLIAQFSEGGSSYTDSIMTTPASPHSRTAQYPVQFVFITAHANGGGEGDSSDVPNEQIRAHVIANDRMLFDFSDIENYDPDSNYFLDKRVDDSLNYDNELPYNSGDRNFNWASEYLTLHDDGELDQLTHGDGVAGYEGTDTCAHSDGPGNDARLNCVLKGRAVWNLFARLAGWNGGGADTTAPIISEITAVPNPTNDNTPDYTFNTDEAGTITYGGSCSSSTTSATTGDNTVTFNELSPGTYSNCTVKVTDSASNVSNALSISEFTIKDEVEEAQEYLYRFWSKKNKSHFYTASEEEKDYIIAHYDEYTWKYEGVANDVFATQVSNSVPVYRFWSKKNKGHFYTASEEEKDLVIAKYDDDVWKYEGVAYYAYPTLQSNSKPIFRFWSSKNKHHFYTASEEEKNLVISKYDDYVWKYEGIAWYVAQ